MARPRKMQRLNDAKPEVIAENILKQDPEGLPKTEDAAPQIVVSPTIPEYRKVVFINGRDSGYPLEFHYCTKTHPLKQYKLLHGFEYNLPVEVIEHLEQCNEPIYAYRKGLDGHPEMYVISRKYHFQLRTPAKAKAA